MAGGMAPLWATIARFAAHALAGVVRLYQLLISPVFPSHCRFEPSCSAYAIQALHRHGPVRGAWLGLWRILRCNPWGEAGYDPVPPSRHETLSVPPRAVRGAGE